MRKKFGRFEVSNTEKCRGLFFCLFVWLFCIVILPCLAIVAVISMKLRKSVMTVVA